MVLTTGASLLVASLLRLRSQDPGFVTERLLAATVELPQARYDYESGRLERTFDDIRDNVLRVPGVVDAGWVTALPMSPVGTDYDIEFYRTDRPAPAATDAPPTADFRVVSEGYVEALGLPLLAGRRVENDLPSGAPGSIVVNRALAERYFAGADPLGKSLRIFETDGEAFEIVGVVGNVRHRGLDDAARPEIYVEFHRMAHDAMTVLVRPGGEPSAWADDIVSAVRMVDRVPTPVRHLSEASADPGRRCGRRLERDAGGQGAVPAARSAGPSGRRPGASQDHDGRMSDSHSGADSGAQPESEHKPNASTEP